MIDSEIKLVSIDLSWLHRLSFGKHQRDIIIQGLEHKIVTSLSWTSTIYFINSKIYLLTGRIFFAFELYSLIISISVLIMWFSLLMLLYDIIIFSHVMHFYIS